MLTVRDEGVGDSLDGSGRGSIRQRVTKQALKDPLDV